MQPVLILWPRVLADSRVAATVTDVGAIPGTGIPGHLPVVFTLAMEQAS